MGRPETSQAVTLMLSFMGCFSQRSDTVPSFSSTSHLALSKGRRFPFFRRCAAPVPQVKPWGVPRRKSSPTG